MKIAYPTEERFSAESFGDCSIIFVEQALKAIEDRDLAVADYQALPVALLGELFARSKGVEGANTEYFNPYQALLYKRNAKEAIGTEIARTFLQLTNQKRVPSWVVEIVDLKLIRAAAS